MAVEDPNVVSRRELLKGGAVLGASVLWATPLVQVIGMSPAFAVPPSPVCQHRYQVKWDPARDLKDVGVGNYASGAWSTSGFFCVTGGESPTPVVLGSLGLPASLKVIAGDGPAVGHFGVELDLSNIKCTFNPGDGAQGKCASENACSGGQPCEDASWDAGTQVLTFDPCYCASENKYFDVSHIEVILCCE